LTSLVLTRREGNSDMSVSTLPPALKPMTQVRSLDSQDRSEGFRVILQSDGLGVIEVPEQGVSRVAIHLGRPVKMDCKHGAKSHCGLAIHGDIDIIPKGIPSRWEMKETDTALILRVGPHLLRQVAEESGFQGQIEVRSRFRIRDSQIEHIGLALMAEVQHGYPSGPLYMDCMATALAVQLLRNYSSVAGDRSPREHPIMGRHRLRQVQSYIEENLPHSLSLQVIADVVGMSISHLKVTFREATGMPVHQYVIRRRVERAALMLREGKLPISRIALDVGFAHQSHLAMRMKRLLGMSPSHLLRSRSDSIVAKV
jgi:AraC family transcriptional regulator